MPSKTTQSLFLSTALLLGCTASRDVRATGHEPIVGGPCEGCEAVFEGLPEHVPTRTRVAPANEPGEPLRIEGRVTRRDGSPAPGTIVYVYHTDARGIYPQDDALRGRAAQRHGTLRGWARADSEGRYGFETIRPASYPDTDVPQHVHVHVLEPGRCTYYVDPIEFTDDPLLPAAGTVPTPEGRGGSGIVTPRRDEHGTWLVERDIVLGLNIPGYPEPTSEP